MTKCATAPEDSGIPEKFMEMWNFPHTCGALDGRGIIPNEHLASGTDQPWSTWRSLNRLRVQKGRRRAMTKMWKLSHTEVCACGKRQTMSHPMTCVDAHNCTWTDLAMPTLAGVNCAKHWEEFI